MGLGSKQVKRWAANPGEMAEAPTTGLAQVPYAKSPSRLPDLGQTGGPVILCKAADAKHMNQTRQTSLADLGQTQVWPNTC
jgi:hypothetical protein